MDLSELDGVLLQAMNNIACGYWQSHEIASGLQREGEGVFEPTTPQRVLADGEHCSDTYSAGSIQPGPLATLRHKDQANG